MSLYDIVNRVLLAEYSVMVVLALFTSKPITSVYWFGAVILQLGVILGLK